MVLTKSFMYVVKCSDDTLYVGYTTNILRRLEVHNAKKGAKYTKSRVPVILKYYEEFLTKSEAIKREYAFKQLKKENKLAYIQENLTQEKKNYIKEINAKLKEKNNAVFSTNTNRKP